MKCCHICILITAACSLQFQPAIAQSFKYGARIGGELHIPTQSECIEALNAGKGLGLAPDGRLLVVNGDVIYWIGISPAFLDCAAAKFPPKEE